MFRRECLRRGRNRSALAETTSLARFSLAGQLVGQQRVRSPVDVLTLGPDGALWYATSDGAKVGRVKIGP